MEASYIPKKLASRTSQCLSEACIQLATTYTNCIVENFEARLLKYLSYLIQYTFVSMVPQDVNKMAYGYCYQSVCKGEPKWPQGVTFTQETKTAADEACLPLQQLITTQVTLKELSASQVLFCLVFCIYYRNMKKNIKSTMLMMLEDYLCVGFFLYYQTHRCTGDASISAQILYLPLLKNLYHGDTTIS
ncbi:hypothetical protein BCV72DRAFT_321480 [Rhizopus microsporus var. microsporus]|uniref:Uncharacterized protein n=2 Tax=Rhizopus microsporus TaxID=58291 RepID=A0A2G4SHE8_RHIZD|nr:uncharacterized protein RHIMIDRAFT_79150 [Rhizopus microsporus ATCC 52813]ORE01429.1 hypothetical protein BCV72DRAFT_321480 [Rhizopus microsporus var. microsporus]PHZ08200.1 hypothetical protein RHIMIDRAFT_79150 [Rhizopus microsporus ATCC 52813]